MNLCKAFVSSTILGYPIPSIIDWGATGGEENVGSRRARQMEKIFTVSAYLDGLTDAHPEDLVLMTDSLDVWFQLPPEILIQRYNELNACADARARGQLSPTGTSKYSQKIVFSAEKKCWPRAADEIGCAAMPESDLPDDVYGPQTDENAPIPEYVYATGIRDSEGKLVDQDALFRHMRPRYLNSGFVLATVPEARALFERAAAIANADPEVYGADQGVIAQILGEQTVMRERQQPGAGAILEKRGKVEDFAPEEGQQYEFGIGLDYERSLSIPTSFAENDTAWVVLQDKDAIKEHAEAANITHPRVLDQGLQPDIAALAGPFADMPANTDADGSDSGSAPISESLQSTTWDSIPLFTDLWTGVTPVIVHHNAQHFGKKLQRDDSWWQMWFAGHVRTLFDSQIAKFMKSPEQSNSKSTTTTTMAAAARTQRLYKNGRKEVYGAIPVEMLEKEGFGAETIDKDGKRGWVKWEELCDEKAQREVFEEAAEMARAAARARAAAAERG